MFWIFGTFPLNFVCYVIGHLTEFFLPTTQADQYKDFSINFQNKTYTVEGE